MAVFGGLVWSGSGAVSFLAAQEEAPSIPESPAPAVISPAAASESETAAPVAAPRPEQLGYTDLVADVASDQAIAAALSRLESSTGEGEREAAIRALAEALKRVETAPAGAEVAGEEGEGEPSHDELRAAVVSADAVLFRGLPQRIAPALSKFEERDRAAWSSALEANGIRAAAYAPSPRAAGSLPSSEGELFAVHGGYAHAAIATDPGALGGYTKWIHTFEKQRELTSSQEANRGFYRFLQPQIVTRGELVFVRAHQDVFALERETGTVRWHVPSDRPENRQSHHSSAGFKSFRYFTDIGGWALTLLPGEPDQLIVLDSSGRPSRSGGSFHYKHQSRLRSYEAESGQLLWELGDGTGDDALTGFTFAAPPTPVLAAGDGADARLVLVAPVVTPRGYFVAGLSPEGKRLWLKKLYGYSEEKSAADAIYNSGIAHGASLAASGDTFVGAPGHGVVFAMRASGELLWMRRYSSSVRRRNEDPRWAPGHPIIVRDTAIVAPFDSEVLLAIDVETGELRWEEANASYSLLLGAGGDLCYTLDLTGQVLARSLASGQIAWTSSALGAPAGRGWVTSDRLYVSLESELVVLDAATGGVLDRGRIWDASIPKPIPGNVFASRGELYCAAPWGIARLEAFADTLARINAFPRAQRPVVRGRLLRRSGDYEGAIAALRRAFDVAREDQAKRELRTELLDLAREAVATTKNAAIARGILADPRLALRPRERSAFLLRMAASLASSSPSAVAPLFRRIIADAEHGTLVDSPSGVLVDAEIYASTGLRDLLQSGKIPPDPDEEEQTRRRVAASVDAGDEKRLADVVLRRAHVIASSSAHVALAVRAAERGEWRTAIELLDRLAADVPALGESSAIADRIALWRNKVPEEIGRLSTDASFDVPWHRHFDESRRPGVLVHGVGAQSAVFVLAGGRIRSYREDGATAADSQLAGWPDLSQVRPKLKSRVLEPAFVREFADRVVASSPAGVYSLRAGEDGAWVAQRWLERHHAVDKRWKRLGDKEEKRTTIQFTAAGVRSISVAEKFGTIDGEGLFYPECRFVSGAIVLLDPDGSLSKIEAGSGRLVYQQSGGSNRAARLLSVTDERAVAASVDPPGVVLHDFRSNSADLIPAAATPWRGEIVPGLAIVLDTPAGIEVRHLPPRSSRREPMQQIALWRDAKPRGRPALVYADARRVVATEGGDEIVARTLRSGRVIWRATIPGGWIPRFAHATPGRESLIAIGAGGSGAAVPYGVLAASPDQDVAAIKIDLASGEIAWTTSLVAGPAAIGEARYDAGGRLALAVAAKSSTWVLRLIRLDLELGAVSTVFEHATKESGANCPPPRLAATRGGIAIGAGESWAWFSPREVPEALLKEAEEPLPETTAEAKPAAAEGAAPPESPADVREAEGAAEPAPSTRARAAARRARAVRRPAVRLVPPQPADE